MLWHDDFFTDTNGKICSYWKEGAKKKNYFLIQHPYTHFGSLCNPYLWRREKRVNPLEFKTPIYVQEFTFNLGDNEFDIPTFLKNVEVNARLKPDEQMWYETGFWTVTNQDNSYIGMGVERLKQIIANDIFDFAICFTSYTTILLISSGKKDEIKIKIVSSNDYLPFVEVLEPFRKAIATYKNVNCSKGVKLQEEHLRRFWYANHSIELKPVAYIMDKDDPTYRRHPIIKNEFKRTRDNLIKSIDFLTGTTPGGFTETDYNSGKLFDLHAEIWDFEGISLIEFFFIPAENL